MIFIEPSETFTARHAYGPSSTGILRGVQHLRAPVVMSVMPANGTVSLWKLINRLTKETRPSDRPQHRSRRLSFWLAVRDLLKVKLLFRHKGVVSRHPIPFKPKKRVRRKRCVADSISNSSGSNDYLNKPLDCGDEVQSADNQVNASESPSMTMGTITEFAIPSKQEVSSAAKALASLPRPRKGKWTGDFNGKPVRRRTSFKVPTGETLPAIVVKRGKVYGFRGWGSDLPVIERFDESEVEIVKNPAAALLGSLKLGKKEQPSRVKAESARKNGKCPVKVGSRPRGRPRKVSSAGIH